MAEKASSQSVSELQAEIASATSRLASNIEGLITQAHPKAIVNRGVADAKGFVRQEFAGVKDQFVTARGDIKTDRVALLVAAVAGAIGFVITVRSLLKQR